MRITALLLNYKRKDNLLKIIQSLRSQSISMDIFLWNNNDTDHTEYDVDLQINSSKNLMCSPRWLLSCYATTDYVFSLDDDLLPKDKEVIKHCLNFAIDNGCAVGYTGVVLNSMKDYWSSRHIHNPSANNNIFVDILKGRFILCKKDEISKVDWINEQKGNDYRIEDDILLSSKLSKKIIPSILYRQMIDLPQNDALMHQHNHKKSRTQAVLKYFDNDSINTNTYR